jgi:hypothetical protein
MVKFFSSRGARTQVMLVALLTSSALRCSAEPLEQASANTNPGMNMTHAKGSFTVQLERQKDADADPKLARMTIKKQFTGDLEGTSAGQMLSAGTEVKGSAGYVAMEKVTGKLNGRSGSFILQHTATMDRGTPLLSITVVPDSGTAELMGISGTMQIIITNGQHSYDFEYQIKP